MSNRRHLFLFFCVMIYVFGGMNDLHAQKNNLWQTEEARVKNFPREDYYRQLNSEVLEDKHKKKWLIERLKKENLQAISESITTKVASSSETSVRQTTDEEGSKFEEDFESYTKLTSEVVLPRNTTWTYEAKKIVSGNELFVFTFIKKEHLYHLCREKINEKIGQAEEKLDKILTIEHPTRDNYPVIKKELKKTKELKDQIDGLNMILIANGQDNEYQDELERLARKIQEGELKFSSARIDLKYNQAKKMMQDDPVEALNLMEKILSEDPTHERTKKAKKQCVELIKDQYLGEIQKKRNVRDYNEAVEQLTELMKILPSHMELQNFKQDIRQEQFDYLYHKVQPLLYTDLSKANMFFRKLKMVSHVDLEAFNKLKAEVEKANKDDSLARQKKNYYENLNEARSNLYDQDFDIALRYIRRAKAIGYESDDVDKLERKIRRKYYRSELKTLKKSRPHLYCFRLGARVLNNMISLKQISRGEVYFSHLWGDYDIGFYRKMNIREKFKKEKDRSTANLAGLYFSVTDMRQFIKLGFGEEKPSKFINTEGLYEVGVAYSFREFFDTRLGFISLDDLSFSQKTYYNLRNSINIRIGDVYIEFHHRFLSDLKKEFYSSFGIGLIYKLDLFRRIDVFDRKKIKTDTGK